MTDSLTSKTLVEQLRKFHAEIVECDEGRESEQMKMTREAAEEIERLQQRVSELENTDTSHLPYEKGWQDGRADAWKAYNASTAEPPEASDAEKILMFIYNDQFTSLSREAFQRCFDYYQQQRRVSETKNEYRVPSSTPAGETAAAAGAESTADPSIDDEQHTDSLIEKLESVVAGETPESMPIDQFVAELEKDPEWKEALDEARRDR